MDKIRGWKNKICFLIKWHLVPTSFLARYITLGGVSTKSIVWWNYSLVLNGILKECRSGITIVVCLRDLTRLAYGSLTVVITNLSQISFWKLWCFLWGGWLCVSFVVTMCLSCGCESMVGGLAGWILRQVWICWSQVVFRDCPLEVLALIEKTLSRVLYNLTKIQQDQLVAKHGKEKCELWLQYLH